MPSLKTMLLASTLLLATFALSACAKNNFNAAGYDAIEKNNRLYLFVHGSKAEKTFKDTGEMPRSVTRLGKGPNGMTIVAEPDVNIDKYLAALGTRFNKK